MKGYENRWSLIKNDVKPVIVLYNPTHGLYRSGVLRDMIEMIHGVDGAGNLKIIERGKGS